MSNEIVTFKQMIGTSTLYLTSEDHDCIEFNSVHLFNNQIVFENCQTGCLTSIEYHNDKLKIYDRETKDFFEPGKYELGLILSDNVTPGYVPNHISDFCSELIFAESAGRYIVFDKEDSVLSIKYLKYFNSSVLGKAILSYLNSNMLFRTTNQSVNSALETFFKNEIEHEKMKTRLLAASNIANSISSAIITGAQIQSKSVDGMAAAILASGQMVSVGLNKIAKINGLSGGITPSQASDL